jgi:4a-hydroxytetrahydrobiopterin dehydratase
MDAMSMPPRSVVAIVRAVSDDRFMALKDESCTACRPGSPQVTGAQATALLREIPGWNLVERDGVSRLERVFTFANFVDALAFTNAIGALAEDAGHHPAITTEWGRATVAWWTHAITGLHRNDFVMAAKTGARYPGR